MQTPRDKTLLIEYEVEADLDLRITETFEEEADAREMVKHQIAAFQKANPEFDSITMKETDSGWTWEIISSAYGTGSVDLHKRMYLVDDLFGGKELVDNNEYEG